MSYDPESGAWKIYSADPAVPPGADDLKSVLPGRAYWVNVGAPSARIPSVAPACRKTFYHPDHLGSTALLTNHLGSTALLTDETGKVTARFEYYPYGKLSAYPYIIEPVPIFL